jgi:hypothetical protein
MDIALNLLAQANAKPVAEGAIASTQVGGYLVQGQDFTFWVCQSLVFADDE